MSFVFHFLLMQQILCFKNNCIIRKLPVLKTIKVRETVQAWKIQEVFRAESQGHLLAGESRTQDSHLTPHSPTGCGAFPSETPRGRGPPCAPAPAPRPAAAEAGTPELR